MTIANKLKQYKDRVKKDRPPLWEGPEGEGPNGGVTYSLLSRWLCCRERFRVAVIEGLRPAPTFNHRIEYGQMWHTCEEALAEEKDWKEALVNFTRPLLAQYPLQQEQIQHWYQVCLVQFPEYVRYWSAHPDVVDRKPLWQEKVFDVPYSLPSGRVVRLRGKWDSVDLIGKGRERAIYLQENKTKGDIREGQLKRQLSFDLQTMLYVIALRSYMTPAPLGDTKLYSVAGVRYNVVRRPLSGGKGTITRHKPSKKNPQGESVASFYRRVQEVIAGDASGYFMRWVIQLSDRDVKRFETDCLIPILETLCYWYEVITDNRGSPPTPLPKSAIHWVHPFGVFNVLDEGGSTDLDEYLLTGSPVGLERVSTLFNELT